ncbi:MAG TPA: FAD-dependent oxidoreductase, partial [Roseiflexaceae bacterium]|nr:FAD-dependent oxidoreductase [Roseiflexaceae bacterium]
LRVRRAARVDGRLLARALEDAARARGLAIRREVVGGIVVRGDLATGVEVAGETIAAGAVVLAAGAWSAALVAPLGVRLPVMPQRGQIIHLALPGADTAGWPVVLPFHGHYMVPWPEGRVVVGATREFAGYAPQPTAAGMREVLAEALRVAPGLADAVFGEVRVGLRPSTPDGLPVLGPTPGVRGLYLATGHGATGLTLGPYSGKLVAALALGEPVAEALAPFACTRF